MFESPPAAISVMARPQWSNGERQIFRATIKPDINGTMTIGSRLCVDVCSRQSPVFIVWIYLRLDFLAAILGAICQWRILLSSSMSIDLF